MIKKRFEIINGAIECNHREISGKQAVFLLNEADDIINKLTRAFGYCIQNNVDLSVFRNKDDLFVYLEKIGVI